jgi:hypothetical protein
MKALGITLAVAAAGYWLDQQYYDDYCWRSFSSMVQQISHSFGWH